MSDGRSDDLRDKADALRRALESDAPDFQIAELVVASRVALDFRSTDAMIGLTPADPGLIRELEKLVRTAEARVGFESPAEEPFAARTRVEIDRLSKAISEKSDGRLVAAMSSALDLLEALNDDDLDLDDEDARLGQELLRLLNQAKARVFKPEPPDVNDLYRAMLCGDVARCKDIFAAGVQADLSCLLLAVKSGNLDLLKAALTSKPDLDNVRAALTEKKTTAEVRRFLAESYLERKRAIVPAIEQTIKVKDVDLGPDTDYDAIVLQQIQSDKFFYRDVNAPMAIDPLTNVLSEIRDHPQHYRLARAAGKLIIHPDPNVRAEAIWLLYIERQAAAACWDLILAQATPEHRPLFKVPDPMIPSTRTIDSKLLFCLGYLVEDYDPRAGELAKREVVRSDVDGVGLLYALLRTDRDWVREHREAIAAASPDLAKILAKEL